MKLWKYVLESPPRAEVYVTVVPPADASPGEQVRRMFSVAGEVLRETGARVLQERVFAGAEALEEVPAARAEGYGDLTDAVGPTRLISPPAAKRAPAGLQVHAVRGTDLEVLSEGGRGAGRVARAGARAWAALSGIASDASAPRAEQARANFERAEALLARAGGDMRCVARTWVWLGDILGWYDEFNGVRNRFYARRGLTRPGGSSGMPASTGIGVALAGGAACGLDLLAAVAPAGAVRYLPAAGRQQSAYDYGSAFSRAASADTPAARTVWVSGTAAIDAAGASRRAGDPGGQIEMTLANVRAVLHDQGCGDGDVVQAVAYCKTAEVLSAWEGGRGELAWPAVNVLSDICRPELLFELEATASVAGNRQ